MIWGVISLVVSIISSVVQHRKQKKAEKKAKEEAEKRAGFQLTVKGEAQAVPIVYGRQKVGATLADVKTRNSYVYNATAGASNIWAIGAFSKLGESITWDTDRYRNAILMTQYAICQGDIESIEHVEVDDVDYDDKEFNKATDARGAHRIVTYNAGGTPCPLATANGMPANNKFTDLAFATGVFFLSRDEPQYFQIPDVSFYVKGKKIPQVTENLGVYSYDRNTVSYSNNPALVLLDYLTGEYGMDLSVSDIDLKSFYDAAITCDLTVNPGAGALGAIQRRGHIWNRDGTNDYNQLNAYTLNGNSYLSFIGPSGATIDLSALQATLAGSGETYQVVAETGHYDIDFTNSSYNGTSDEIEVPVADTTPVDGATTIVTATEIPEYDLSQLVIRANTGENTLTLYECNITIDPSDTVRDNVAAILNSMPGASLIWSEGKFKLRLPYYASQTDLRNAAAATLVVTDDILANQAVKTIYPNADNKLNTASVRFLDEQDNFKQGTVTWPEKGGAVETTYLNEDNGVVLQNFLDGAGISDPYHATALAEQTVRESRRAVEYEFECFPDAYALEPGDVIRLNSEINNITSIDDILHVDKVTLKENMNVVVNAHLIHASDYAWNIGAEILPPFSTRPSSFFLYPPITTNAEIAEVDLGNDTVYGFRAIPDDHKIFLRWKGGSPGSFYGYEVEYAYAGYTDDDDWIPAGQTRNETFDLFVGNPSLAVYVRVKTISITGGKSPPSLVMGPISLSLVTGVATAGTYAIAIDLERDLTTAAVGEFSIVGVNPDGTANTDKSVLPYILWNGSKINIPHIATGITGYTGVGNTHGFICMNTTLPGNSFTVGGISVDIAFVYKNSSGQWQYDNNTSMVNFTPTDDYVAIGWLATGTANNIDAAGPIGPVTLTLASFPKATDGADLGTNFRNEAGFVLADIDVRNDQLVTASLGAINQNPSMSIPRTHASGLAPASWFNGNTTAALPVYLDDTVRDVMVVAPAKVVNGTALPANPKATYEFSALVKSSTGTKSCKLRSEYTTNDLGTGEVWVGLNTGEAGGHTRTGFEGNVATDSNVTTGWRVVSGTWTPPVGVKWFSPSIFDDGVGAGDLHVEWFVVAELATTGATAGDNLTDSNGNTLGDIDVRNDQLVTDALSAINANPSMEIPADRSGTLGPASWRSNAAGVYPTYVDDATRDVALMTLASRTLNNAAFSVNPDTQYEVKALVRMVTTTTNMDLRVESTTADLGQGKKYIGSTTVEDMQVRTNINTINNDFSLTTAWTVISGTWTPPSASTKWASASLYPNGSGNDWEVDWLVVKEKSTRNTGALADLNTVDTAEISSQAVNVLKSEYNAANLDATQSYQNVNTLTSVATEGAPVVINFFCRSFISTINTNSCSHYFYLYRDTTPIQLFTGLNFCPGNSSSGGSVALSYVDYGATGTHTYYMKYQQSTSTANTDSSYVDYRSMTAMAVLDQP